jgi:hypothetical protein
LGVKKRANILQIKDIKWLFSWPYSVPPRKCRYSTLIRRWSLFPEFFQILYPPSSYHLTIREIQHPNINRKTNKSRYLSYIASRDNNKIKFDPCLSWQRYWKAIHGLRTFRSLLPSFVNWPPVFQHRPPSLLSRQPSWLLSLGFLHNHPGDESTSKVPKLIICLYFSHHLFVEFSHFGQQAFHHFFRHWFHFCKMVMQLPNAVFSPANQSNPTSYTNCHEYDCDYRQILVWGSRLLDTWLYFTIHYHTHSVHSHVFTSRCSVVTSNADVPFPLSSLTVLMPQLPASHSNSSQRPNLSSSLSHWLTNSITNRLIQPNWLT